jgi:hypothetical protein
MSERTESIIPTSTEGKKLLELLYTVYGVPRTASEVVVTIRALEPITIKVDYRPTREKA